MFDFRDMLYGYSQDFYILNKATGAWNTSTGKYVEGATTKQLITAPILPLTNDDIANEQSGTYTRQDKKIYIHIDIANGKEVEINSEIWTVMAVKDYSQHANGLIIAIIRKRGDASV